MATTSSDAMQTGMANTTAAAASGSAKDATSTILGPAASMRAPAAEYPTSITTFITNTSAETSAAPASST